ncbi:MAG TPA: hypothetical protein VLB44_03925 [Kofleriaceae bacterium]|nr:hypothetical protein [Kofleriaceae bacterium]
MHAILRNLAVVASTLLAAHAADAKPRRVVVLDFDGPRQLADNGRSAVMSVLGDQYNIVATKSWDSARARASGRGPQQWRQASKQAGVDAVIEGWVQSEGRHHVLTIAVRDAATGNEIDTLSVRIKGSGVTPEAGHKLAAQLDDLLGWIDGDISAEPTSSLPDVRTMRPMLGAHDPSKDRARASDDRDEDEADSDEDEAPVRKRHHKKHRKVKRVDTDEDEAQDETPAAKDDDDSDASETADKADRTDKKVAAADDVTKDTSDLVTLFGPESKEAAIVSDGKTKHVPVPTPRFQISAGPYVTSRGMTWSYDPNAKGNPPEYPASSITGFDAQVAVYPLPLQKEDGRVSGLGFSLDLKHSVAGVITAMDDTGYGDYTITHVAWETGIHYRYPIDIITIDGSANFGNVTHALSADFPQSVAIPDTSYSYLGAGVHVDLQVTEHASVGAGARYMYLLGAGPVTDQDWYGAGKANGLALDGDFILPLPHKLYVKGGIEYRRVKIDFEGSGELTQQWGVWDMTDSSISGTGNLGVEF